MEKSEAGRRWSSVRIRLPTDSGHWGYTISSTSGADLRGRDAALDILRAVAVFLVLGRHMERAPDTVTPTVKAFFDAWNRGGWIGVDVFFVLSGFLVSGLLLREYKQRGSMDVIRFYVRRGLKIYPAFYVFIAATVLVRFATGDSYPWSWLISEVVFLQSYFRGLWPHTWSLAVEEHFYFMVPLLLLVLVRRNKGAADPFRPLLGVAALLGVSLLALRLIGAGSGTFRLHPNLYWTHIRIDALMFGVALAYLYHFHHGRLAAFAERARGMLLVGGLLALAPAFVFVLESTPFIYTWGLTVFSIGSAAVLLSIVGKIPRHRLVVRGVANIGAYSYSIYIWHFPVRAWLVPLTDRIAPDPSLWPLRAALYVFLSVAVGVAMAKAVEFPVLRVRDRLFPSRSGAAVVHETGDAPAP